MKNTVLFLALFIYSLSFSQKKDTFLIRKNTIEITGDTSLWLNTNERESTNENYTGEYDNLNFNFSPNLGYAIKDNLIIGLGAGYGHNYNKSKHENNNPSKYKSEGNSYSVFSYVKKYVPLNNKLAIGVRGEVSYSHTDSKSKSYGNTTEDESYRHNESDGIFIGLRPDISFFIAKKIILKANIGALGYNSSKSKNNIGEEDEYENKSKRFNFSFNTANLGAGLTFLLN